MTQKDFSDSAFSVQESGGKKGFLSSITSRKGLPEDTQANKFVAEKLVRLRADVGAFAMPHPFKHADGVAHGRRQYGADDLNEVVQWL